MKNQGRLLPRKTIILISRENKDLLITLKLEQCTLDNGKEVLETAMGNKNGLMALNMQANGEKIELMGREDLFMLMEMFMMAFGLMTKLMAMEYINMLMGPSMKVNGKMISSTEKVQKLGLMVLVMTETTPLEENMVQEHINGMMVLSILEIGERIKYQGQEFTPGQMVENMRENGKIITWKGQVYMSGMMEEFMKVSTKMTKNTVSVFIRGLMGDATKDFGLRGNNMEQAHMLFLKKISLSMGFGKMVKELNGLMKMKCR